MSQGEEEVDPEPCRLFRSFNIEEDTVGLSVDLYSFEENKEDSYTIDHECNQGDLCPQNAELARILTFNI